MQRSLDRILTTHVGSLPRPDDLYAMIAAKQEGGKIDEVALAARVKSAVAERIGRFARVVGEENVIAGAGCGFASFAATCEVHPSLVWVKLAALAEGARIASKTLWG